MNFLSMNFAFNRLKLNFVNNRLSNKSILLLYAITS